MTPDVGYDQLAACYHERYALNRLEGVGALLRGLARELSAVCSLEVGCGTGRWLAELAPLGGRVTGLDYSAGMLSQAQALRAPGELVRGQASELPFAAGAFDLVFCVNALHHFPDRARFVAEARRLLRPRGALCIVGLDPRAQPASWYLYTYFPGTREADLARFASVGQQLDWMVAAGFERAAWQVAERIDQTLAGRAVLGDHFLTKQGTSQLALLSDDAYQAGLARIEAALTAAEARGETLSFPTRLVMNAVVGYAPPYLASMRAMR